MGKIKIERLNQEQKKALGIPETPKRQGAWSVWECEPSAFDWHYDSLEQAYVYQGKVRVKAGQEEVEINAGDFVTFPKGLSCRWEIQEKVRKVYRFS